MEASGASAATSRTATTGTTRRIRTVLSRQRPMTNSQRPNKAPQMLAARWELGVGSWEWAAPASRSPSQCPGTARSSIAAGRSLMDTASTIARAAARDSTRAATGASCGVGGGAGGALFSTRRGSGRRECDGWSSATPASQDRQEYADLEPAGNLLRRPLGRPASPRRLDGAAAAGPSGTALAASRRATRARRLAPLDTGASPHAVSPHGRSSRGPAATLGRWLGNLGHDARRAVDRVEVVALVPRRVAPVEEVEPRRRALRRTPGPRRRAARTPRAAPDPSPASRAPRPRRRRPPCIPCARRRR